MSLSLPPPVHILLEKDMGCVHSRSPTPRRFRVRRSQDAWTTVVAVRMPCDKKEKGGEGCSHIVEYGDGMIEALSLEKVRTKMKAAGLDTFPAHVQDHVFPGVRP